MINNDIKAFNELVDIGLKKEIEFNQRVSCLKKAIILFNKIKNHIDKVHEFSLYRIYRELGSLYYTTNRNSEESILYFDKSLLLSNEHDNKVNIFITKQMLSESLVLQYLKTNKKQYLIRANQIINEIFDYLYEYNDGEYAQIVTRSKHIVKEALENNIKTQITFLLPFHIILPEKQEILFKHNGLDTIISTETIRSNSFIVAEGNSLIFNKKDKYGLLNKTLITISIYKYIDPNNKFKVNNEIGSVWLPLVEAVNVFNSFLNIYRNTTGFYWLDNVNELMIQNYEVKVIVGKEIVKNIPINISNEISSVIDWTKIIDNQLFLKIKQNALSFNTCLWNEAYNHSLNQYQIKNYKESILYINIALENYLSISIKKLLKDKISESALDDFLTGKINYDNFIYKDFINKDDFYKLKKEGKISETQPTAYAIINFISDYCLDLNKKEIKGLISKIKKNRNEIIHGHEIKCNLEEVSLNSIKSFDKLTSMLNK